MTLVELKRDVTPAGARRFALLVLPGFCLAMAGIAAWRWQMTPAAGALAGLAVVSLLLGWLRPRLMRPVLLAWHWLAFPLGWLVAHLVLAAIFFVLLTPIALVMRIVGRDPLARHGNRDAETYWTPRQPPDRSRYFRQF